MASTGFWPVKSRLKEVIDYAENPDKTTDKKFLDEDLWAALRYVENDQKTDQTMYVSGINCPKQRAYQCMMATKRRYGKLGGNVAYHGYQSFVAEEVTPAEAHRIGVETAKRMWGANYEVVVTTHLNTDNIHNHFVINSVSFKTGRKFENHIRDHVELRQISDAVCKEHGKSVIPFTHFYGNKKAYWVQKSGKLTHRDILRKDVDEGRISFTPAVELSYLNEQEQYDLLEQMELNDCTPSLSQACRFKKMSQEQGLTPEVIAAVMSEEKANQREMFKVPMERIRQYVPNANAKQAEDFVLKACEHYRKFLIRQRNRDER